VKLFSAVVVRILSIGVLTAVAGFAAAQQTYPSKPIRFIVPYPAGGSASALARLVGQKMTESWGQPVIVDHRAGGNTIIGSDALAKSAPDGYSIMVVATAHVINALLLPKLPYDTIRDFAPVGTLGSTELVMVLHPSVPANNLQEFIVLAKSRPGQLNFASAGAGGVIHLAGELFNMMTGVKIQHIAYKGTPPALTDLIGGQVQLSYIVPLSVAPHIKSGRLRAIAISGETRLPTLPQVPTFTEAGLPGFDVKFWFGVLAPAGTPKEIIDKLSTEIARILALPDIKENLVGQGMDPYISSPEQFAALIKADMSKFAGVIKAANVKQLD
jgi:tripartite-type tricarboxylate transporter receptor subunit TctC